MKVWLRRVKMSCVISSPLVSSALICAPALASCELPVLAPSSISRDASEMFSTCFRNRAKNFSSRGRSFILPRRGGTCALGRDHLSNSLVIDCYNTVTARPSALLCHNRKQFRLGRGCPTLHIQVSRVQQPVRVQIPHRGKHVLFQIRILPFEFLEDVAQ